MNDTKLKLPIELIVYPRDSGGLTCAVANTVDEGCASVFWDAIDKAWVFAEGLPVGTVFAAVPLSEERMKREGISESISYLNFVANEKKNRDQTETSR